MLMRSGGWSQVWAGETPHSVAPRPRCWRTGSMHAALHSQLLLSIFPTAPKTQEHVVNLNQSNTRTSSYCLQQGKNNCLSLHPMNANTIPMNGKVQTWASALHEWAIISRQRATVAAALLCQEHLHTHFHSIWNASSFCSERSYSASFLWGDTDS